ncbi:MAG: DUF5693 family protein [Candidatus Calescibacterium sp.]|nr:DUF5693 family protein [Candidatus Calescibacterium sp.]MDW8132150.1 DUF5693 family protein [Candidatus Calescibacterium sp.]
MFSVDKQEEKYFVVDYFEAVDFVSSFNYYPDEYFRREILPYFNAVSIRLKTLNELKNEGVVDLATSESIKVEPKFWYINLSNMNWDYKYSFIYCPIQEKMERIEKVIKALKIEYSRFGNVLIVKASDKYLFNLQAFYLEDLDIKKKIFWRVGSFLYDLDYLKVYCRKGDVILFMGPFVAGYPQNLNEVQNFLYDNGLLFAFPEFYDSRNIQLGSNVLAKNGGIKIFSTIVLKNKPIGQVLGSVDLALNERNCNAVMFRFFDKYSLSQNLEVIKEIKNRFFYRDVLKSDSNKDVMDGLLKILIFINLIIFAILIFISYSYYYDILSNNGYPVNSFWFALLGLVNSLFVVVGKLANLGVIFNLALIVGVSFALVTIFFKVFEYQKNVYMRYLEVLIYSLSIGIILNSLFFENVYILGVEKVRFIKLLLILPIVMSIFAVFSYNQIILFFYRRMRILDLSVVLIILGLIGFYLLRSGNTDLVLPFEDKVRNFLDRVLIARPRFKEFLIGNPSILASSYSKYFIPLSFVSLAGIVNSFLHIHTPIFYSFLRTFWGALLGLIIFLLIRKIMEVKWVKIDKIEKGGMER